MELTTTVCLSGRSHHDNDIVVNNCFIEHDNGDNVSNIVVNNCDDDGEIVNPSIIHQLSPDPPNS